MHQLESSTEAPAQIGPTPRRFAAGQSGAGDPLTAGAVISAQNVPGETANAAATSFPNVNQS